MERIDVAKSEFIKMEPRGRAVQDKFWVKHENCIRMVKLSGEGIDQDIFEKNKFHYIKKSWN